MQRTIADSHTLHHGTVEKSDLNGYGLMHGGRLLTLCDEVGYLAAKKHSGLDCLTRAAHDIHFIAAMREGDGYSVEAEVVLAGKTTLWVDCRVLHDGKSVMNAVFVYIAVDAAFRSIPVPEVVAVSEEEKAQQARMIRLRDRVMAGNS